MNQQHVVGARAYQVENDLAARIHARGTGRGHIWLSEHDFLADIAHRRQLEPTFNEVRARRARMFTRADGLVVHGDVKATPGIASSQTGCRRTGNFLNEIVRV